MKVKTRPMTTKVKVGLSRQRLRQQLVETQGNPPTNKLRAQFFSSFKEAPLGLGTKILIN